jgi:hypothetical protein
MKLYMQLSDVDDPEPFASGVATVSMNLDEGDLNKPFDLFSKIFLEPSMAQLKQIRKLNQEQR